MLRQIQQFFLKKRRAPGDESIFAGADISDAAKRIGTVRRYEWVESAFVQDVGGVSSISNKNYLGRGLSGRRLLVAYLILAVGVATLFGRAFYLQAMKGDYYAGIAERNRVRVINLPAPRGIIYDRNGIPLVKNVPAFAVFIVPADFESDKGEEQRGIEWLRKQFPDGRVDDSLNKILALTPAAREYYEPALLIDNLDYQKAMAMRVASVDYSGISVDVAAQREYLTVYNGQPVSSLAHVVGYVGRINQSEYEKRGANGYLLNDYIGKTGVEASFESQLRGRYGKEQVEVDSSGRAKQIIAREEVQKGDNLYLSIDLKMQAKLEDIIRDRLRVMNKDRAASIVINPQNGEVLAMVSYPSFDANLFSKGVSQADFSALINNSDLPLLNRVTSGEYQSGSIIKPVISAAALQEGVINDATSFLSTGGLQISSWFFPDWKAGGHGITNVRKALADSVNTFFYIIGGGYQNFVGLGVDRIKKYGEMFGLNKPTGIDLPSEKSGFLPTAEWKLKTKKEQWYVGDTYHVAIGEGDLLVTPIQVAAYTACFANSGIMFKPQLIDRFFQQSTGREIDVNATVANVGFIDQRFMTTVRQGLRQAVTQGTAKILNGLPVTSAAKTGTAQWQTGEIPHSWFIAFAPYDKAQLAIVTLVEEGGDGTAIAAPISFDFLNWYFRAYKR
ncbi:MAG: penicillin-binding protein 2 [Parcubacteria group bacterium]